MRVIFLLKRLSIKLLWSQYYWLKKNRFCY